MKQPMSIKSILEEVSQTNSDLPGIRLYQKLKDKLDANNRINQPDPIRFQRSVTKDTENVVSIKMGWCVYFSELVRKHDISHSLISK